MTTTSPIDPMKPIWPLTREKAPAATQYLATVLGLNAYGNRYSVAYWRCVRLQTIFRVTLELAEAGVQHPTVAYCLEPREATSERLSG